MCKAKNLVIFEDDDSKALGSYSSTFELWCTKLDGLDVYAFKRGVESLESYITNNVILDREVWPPSYAEFIGHCKKHSNPCHKLYKGLPPPSLSNEENKERMKELRNKIGM